MNSLLTPPPTISRPKENVPPALTTSDPSIEDNDSDSDNRNTHITPTSQGPRVEFAPSASYQILYPATTISPPATTMLSSKTMSDARPLKGILKPFKPTDPAPSPSSPSLASEPAPSEPIEDEEYLYAPLRVLLRSLSPPPALLTELDMDIDSDALGIELAHPTLHDLTESYALLLARLKHARLLLPAALMPLKTHRGALLKALERDVARCTLPPRSNDPTPSSSPPSSPTSHIIAQKHNNKPSSPKQKKKSGVSADEIRLTRDRVAVSHMAMKVCAIILLQPGLHNVFSEKDHTTLLGFPLSITLTTSLPSPTPRRTYTLSIWTLSNTRLPAAAVVPHHVRIARALTRAVQGNILARPSFSSPQDETASTSVSSPNVENAKSESYACLATLLTHYPALLPHLSPLLPATLTALLGSQQSRAKASLAICAFALALKRVNPSPSSSARETLERATNAFLRAKAPSGVDALVTALKPMLNSNSEASQLLPLASALFFLAGPPLLPHTSYKSLLPLLQGSLKRRELLPAFRRCWAVIAWLLAASRSRGVYDVADGEARREKQGKMLRQGVEALSKLRGKGEAAEVWSDCAIRGVGAWGAGTTWGWMDLGNVVRDGKGIEILLDLVTPPSETPEQDEAGPEALLCEAMWDGRAAKGDFGVCGAPAGKGRRMGRENVRKEWVELGKLWWSAIRADREHDAIPKILQHLIAAQLPEPTPEAPAAIAALLVSLLTSAPESFRPLDTLEPADWLRTALACWRVAASTLGEALYSWEVERSVKGKKSKQTVACMLGDELAIRIKDGKLEGWRKPVVTEVLAASARATDAKGLVDMFGEVESEWRRAVWPALAIGTTESVSRGELMTEEKLFAVLNPPWLAQGEMDGEELEALRALVKAVADREGAETAMTVLIGQETLKLYPWTFRRLATLCTVLAPPPPVLISLLASKLKEAYSNEAHKAETLRLLANISAALAKVTVEAMDFDTVAEMAQALELGVGPWIRDELEYLSDEEYNTYVGPLYTTLLNLLGPLTPPTASALVRLAPLLASAFYRMPAPGLCPRAFRAFWTTTFACAVPGSLTYPDELKPGLRYFMQVDDRFAPGLDIRETQTESQAASQILADSEPERLRQRSMALSPIQSLQMPESQVEESVLVIAERTTEIVIERTEERTDIIADSQPERGEMTSSPVREPMMAPVESIEDLVDLHGDDSRDEQPIAGLSSPDLPVQEIHDAPPPELDTAMIDIDVSVPEAIVPKSTADESAYDADVSNPTGFLAIAEVINTSAPQHGAVSRVEDISEFTVSAVRYEQPQSTGEKDEIEPFEDTITPATASMPLAVQGFAAEDFPNSRQAVPIQNTTAEQPRIEPTPGPSRLHCTHLSDARSEIVPETPPQQQTNSWESDPRPSIPYNTPATNRQDDIIPATPSPGVQHPSSPSQRGSPDVVHVRTNSQTDDEEEEASIEASLSQNMEDVPPPTPITGLGKRKRSKTPLISQKRRKMSSFIEESDDEDAKMRHCVIVGSQSTTRPRGASPSPGDAESDPNVSMQQIDDTFLERDDHAVSASQPAISTPRRVLLDNLSLSQPSSPGSSTKKRRQMFDGIELPAPKKRRVGSSTDNSPVNSQPAQVTKLTAPKKALPKPTRSSARLRSTTVTSGQDNASEGLPASVHGQDHLSRRQDPARLGEDPLSRTGTTRHSEGQRKRNVASTATNPLKAGVRERSLRSMTKSPHQPPSTLTMSKLTEPEGSHADRSTPSDILENIASSSARTSNTAAQLGATGKFDPADLPKRPFDALKVLLKRLDSDDFREEDVSQVLDVQAELTNALSMASRRLLAEKKRKI